MLFGAIVQIPRQPVALFDHRQFFDTSRVLLQLAVRLLQTVVRLLQFGQQPLEGFLDDESEYVRKAALQIAGRLKLAGLESKIRRMTGQERIEM